MNCFNFDFLRSSPPPPLLSELRIFDSPGTLPPHPWFESMKRLSCFPLSGSQSGRSFSDSFQPVTINLSAATQLESLDVHFESLFPNEFTPPPRLDKLSIWSENNGRASDNSLTLEKQLSRGHGFKRIFPKDFLRSLTSIRFLNCAGATRVHLDSISWLRRLNSLELGSCSLDLTGCRKLSKLTSLTSISISCTLFGNLPPDPLRPLVSAMSKLPNLASVFLKCEDHDVTYESPFVSSAVMTKLVDLNGHWREHFEDVLSGLPKLRTVGFCHQSSSPVPTRAFPTVETLDLEFSGAEWNSATFRARIAPLLQAFPNATSLHLTRLPLGFDVIATAIKQMGVRELEYLSVGAETAGLWQGETLARIHSDHIWPHDRMA